MADSTDIRKAIEDLPDGTEVLLKLEDGSEVTGTVAIEGTEPELISGDSEEAIDLETVDGVFLESDDDAHDVE